jgi:hypothetical protein
MSRVLLSFLTTSSSPSKFPKVFCTDPTNASIVNRYAEIVNVRLGDGQLRKGQVLEICGKRAVVQVSASQILSYILDLRRYLRH